MFTIQLLVFVAVLVALIATFIFLAKKSHSAYKWPGIAAIVLSAPIFYWVGAFSEQFTHKSVN